MAQRKKGNLAVKRDMADSPPLVSGKGRTSRIAARGVKTGVEFANLMSALMSDVIEGHVSPGMCNAACNAGGKLLKVVEMTIKYGTASGDGHGKQLVLTATTESAKR